MIFTIHFGVPQFLERSIYNYLVRGQSLKNPITEAENGFMEQKKIPPSGLEVMKYIHPLRIQMTFGDWIPTEYKMYI